MYYLQNILNVTKNATKKLNKNLSDFFDILWHALSVVYNCNSIVLSKHLSKRVGGATNKCILEPKTFYSMVKTFQAFLTKQQ